MKIFDSSGRNIKEKGQLLEVKDLIGRAVDLFRVEKHKNK